jgi:hypothetical protein
VAPKIYMSHAWPPVGSGTSPRALTLDPSINTFMSAPAAPEQLRSHVAGAAAEQLRFIILLRDPVSRAQSSARMMREWKWDKSANLSDALLSDLARLRGCSEQIAPSSRAAVDRAAVAVGDLPALQMPGAPKQGRVRAGL